MGGIKLDRRLVAFLATVGFALYGFLGMFKRAHDVFSYPREDMSYGYMVPLFSLYVLWTSRADIRRSLGRPSWGGCLFALVSVAVALLGTRGLQLRFEQLGFIGLCIALPWAFFGRRTAALCVFPAIYLVFTIPLSSFLDAVTIHLRLLASGTALVVLKGFGIDAVQQGTAIIAHGVHGFSIDVAEPCSGLRSLFALTALTAAYSWYSQPTWLRRGVLFLCAVPIAVAGNVTRILSICLVAAGASPDFATGFYHDYSGYVVFIVAIALMVACGELITRIAGRFGRAAPVSAPTPDLADPLRMGENVFAVVMAVVFSLLFVYQSLTPACTITEPPPVKMPNKIAGCRSDDVRYCQEERCNAMFTLSRLERGREGVCPICGGEMLPIALGERTILPADTRIVKRLFRDSSGLEFLVTIVVGGATKSSIHRPELCLPANGFTMSSPLDLDAGGRPWHSVDIVAPRSAPSVLAYTFFNQEGRRTASHVRRIFRDTWDRSVLNRIDRWVMVTVGASAPGGFGTSDPACRRALEDFLGRLSEELP